MAKTKIKLKAEAKQFLSNCPDCYYGWSRLVVPDVGLLSTPAREWPPQIQIKDIQKTFNKACLPHLILFMQNPAGYAWYHFHSKSIWKIDNKVMAKYLIKLNIERPDSEGNPRGWVMCINIANCLEMSLKISTRKHLHLRLRSLLCVEFFVRKWVCHGPFGLHVLNVGYMTAMCIFILIFSE